MYENDVPLGFFFLTWANDAFKFFFVLFSKRIGYNLNTDILRKPNFVFLISWYIGSSLPPPPQPHFIN
jgi:hypothetical protein